MTCDNASGAKLDNIVNNNNVTHELKQNGRQKVNGNGVQMNGGVKRSEKTVLVTEEELETRKSLMILAVIFATGLLALFYIYKNFPRLDE
jgi:hypothetical protein